MGDQQPSLDDVLGASITNSVSTGRSDEASLLRRIEAAAYGEEAPVEEAEVQTDEETTETATQEDEETQTQEVEQDEEEESEDDEAKEETQDEDVIELDESQLAASLGLEEGEVSVDEAGNTLIKTKVDGEVSFVSLKDLKASHQMESHLQGRIKQSAEDKKECETFKEAETGKLQTMVTDATALVVHMEQELMAAVQRTDMDSLRQSNPAEWSAVQREIDLRQNSIQQVKGKLGEIIQANSAEQATKADEVKQAYILEQTEQLITKVPHWSDAEVAKKEIGQLQKAAVEAYGFTEEEISTIGDHRIVMLLMDAIKGRSLDNTESVKKRLKSIPKIMKPGNRKQNTVSIQDRNKATRQNNLKKSGSTKDAAAILLDRM